MVQKRPSPETTTRLARHLPEVATAFVALLVLKSTGLEFALSLWALMGVIAAAAVVVSVIFTAIKDDCSAAQLHARIAIQTAAVTTLAYVTGWGPVLGMIHLFTIADNTRHSGARAVRPGILWAFAGIALGQAGIAVDIAPSLLTGTGPHGVAAIGALVFAFVGTRIAKMTLAKEMAEAALRDREERFRLLVEHSSDVIITVDGEGKITYASPAMLGVLGHTSEDTAGSYYLDLVHPDDRAAAIDCANVLRAEHDGRSVLECRMLHSDGRWVHVEVASRNQLGADVGAFVINLRDVTERARLRSELTHQALHDSLTGMANRVLFHDRVSHAVIRADRRETPFGLLTVDIDGFAHFNDRYGHRVGDELLRQAADRIRACLRDDDTAARLNGDEFAVLVEDLVDDYGPARVAERIKAAFAAPFTAMGEPVTVTPSIGIALGDGSEPADILLRNADIALHIAKRSEEDAYEIFEPAMHLAVVERLQLERDLTRAIEHDELVLHYQPIVELDDQNIKGVEALVRWQHPERGMVSPGAFIPLAEETGLVVPLGRWVLLRATAQVAEWQKLYPSAQPLTVSVNVSARQLAAETVVADVIEALRESGLAPEHLTLEITESALVTETERAVAQLRTVREMGVRIAIDDFGTGYSSLAYLQRFPIDVLKIDRSFIDGVSRGEQSPALVRAIIDLGHSLRMQTVAEGIEHNGQLQQFRELQCNLGQGYLFARPGDSDVIGSLLRTRAPALPVRQDSMSHQ